MAESAKKKSKILVYGACGYTGKLFVKHYLSRHVKDGSRLVLAGRSASKVEALAQEYDCEGRSFSLNDIMQSGLFSDVLVVVNLAGPFSNTQEPLIRACLEHKCHYIDIAGEVDEMERAYSHHGAAKQAGIQLLPGAGFGVVPTDLVSKVAQSQLGQAAHKIQIAYATVGGASRGTLGTVLPTLDQPGVKRIDGKLEKAMPAESNLDFDVDSQSFSAVFNPWRADLFSAALSTGVENIETFTVFPLPVVWMMKGYLLWLRNFLVKYLLSWLPEGPTETELKAGKTYCFAKAISKTERGATVSLEGPDAYLFTVQCLEAVVTQIAKGNTKAGFVTPSFYGKSLLDDMKNVKWHL